MDNKRFRILATTDVHGYIAPYHYSNNQLANMGLSSLACLIKQYKDEHTILIDNGDCLEGSPLAMHHFIKNKEDVHPITTCMKYLQYDYINLGNHDFNYGLSALHKHLNHVGATCLTCNIDPLPYTYQIKEINGYKIAFIGVVTQYLTNWEQPDNIKGLTFLDAFETLKKAVKQVRNQVDYVVGLYHGGFECDLVDGTPTEVLTGENQGYRMCHEIEGLDVLITGHQHRSIATKVNGVTVTQTTCNGMELACIDVYQDKVEASILKPDGQYDKDMCHLIQKQEEACQLWLDEAVGTTKVDLLVKDEVDARIHKHQVITFLNKISMEFTKADLAGNALFNHAVGFKEEITMRDIVSTYVYPNTLIVKEINGRILKAYLEKNAEFFDLQEDEIVISSSYKEPKLQYFNYDMVDGIEYTIKVSNPIGSRITSLTYKGKPVQEEDTFTLVINNYRASGGGDFTMLKDAKMVQEFEVGMVSLLAEYIRRVKVVDFEPVCNIQVIK